MAERSVRRAGLAARWRSRPGVVRVAAGLLGLFGVLLVLIEADERQLGADVLVTGAVLLASAVALVWGGRVGYWIGVTVAGLVAVLLLVALARDPEVVGGFVTAVGAVPLVLLLLPAARRPRRRSRPARSPAREQPQAWRRPFAGGWGSFAFMLLVGGLLSAGGLAMALTGRGAERGAGASVALFFLACALIAPLFRPGRRRGRPRLETVELGQSRERGVVVPYSGSRTALALVASACVGLACLGLVVFAGSFADDPGESPWPVRMVGTVGALFFGLGALVAARRGMGRRWRVVLTPSAVVLAIGRARTVAPWDAIREVRATEVSTYARGVRVSEPLIGIDLSDPQAIETGPLERLLLPLNRRIAADLALPVRTLEVEPSLLLQALRYYHQHPEARPELSTEAAISRLQAGRLTQARSAGDRQVE
jgi:hypothetical protein